MKKEKIEVPFIINGAEIINKYIKHINNDVIEITENDEQKIMNLLIGLAGLIEFNVRIGFQKIIKKNPELGKHDYHNYGSLLTDFNKILKTEENRYELLDACRKIRNSLLHSNFPELFNRTRKVYQLEGIDFHQKDFTAINTFISTTITENGLDIDFETGTAKDKLGNSIKATPLIPGAGGGIERDFNYFYKGGYFIYVYDALMKAYEFSIFFRYDDL